MARTKTNLVQLPKFAGRTPDGQTLKITGSMALPKAMIAGHDLQDVIYVLSACRVSKVGHELDNDERVVRVETLKAARIGLLDMVEGEKLLGRVLADAGIALDI